MISFYVQRPIYSVKFQLHTGNTLFIICSVKYKHNEIFKTAGRISLQPSIILHYFYTAILGRQLAMSFTISHRWSFQLGWSEIETRIYTSNFKRHNSKALIKDIVVFFFSAGAYNMYLKNKRKKWNLKTSPNWPQWRKQKI